jgi:hypothetical protein
MDREQFDTWTKTLSAGTGPRRLALRLLAGGTLTSLLGLADIAAKGKKKKRKHTKRRKAECRSDADCRRESLNCKSCVAGHCLDLYPLCRPCEIVTCNALSGQYSCALRRPDETPCGPVCCAKGETCCGGNACADLQTDMDHCGSCTHSCFGTGASCRDGKCQCASGHHVCPTAYDVDFCCPDTHSCCQPGSSQICCPTGTSFCCPQGCCPL